MMIRWFCLSMLLSVAVQARDVQLAWDEVPGIDSYELYRCDLFTGEWEDLYPVASILPADLFDPHATYLH